MPVSTDKIQSGKIGYMYVGFVKKVEDTKFAGRLRVWIPEMGSREEDENGWVLCNYCSPFAGATNWRDNSTTEFDTFETTQTSYGFWAVPPDINNEVLVVFPNGDPARALWIGSVYKEYMNYMVPGHAAAELNKNVDGQKVPVAEYNKFDKESGDAAKPLAPKRPWNRPHTEGIGNQGLIKDEVRGITTSSSMRESPSAVYGMNTPGPKHETVEGARLGGHSFVLDDGAESEHICLKTRSGAQLRIDETNGIVYAINKLGTAWIQLDEEGNVDIFGAKSMSVRSQEDINFRADRNIIMEAGQNIYLKAAKDTDADLKIVGEDAGLGGNIEFHAINDMHTRVRQSKYTTLEQGNLHSQVQSGHYREYVMGTVDIIYEDTFKSGITGDVDITYSANEKKVVTGDSDITRTGAVKETLQSTHDVDVTGAAKLKASTYDITSSNINVDSSGNLLVTGTGTFGGTVAAPAIAGGSGGVSSGGDIVSSAQSLNALNNHTHGYLNHISGVGQVPSTTNPFGAGGPSVAAPAGPSPSAPSTATVPASPEAVTEAQFKALIDKVNMLETFATSSAITNNGTNVEIPDWWARDMQEVQTIVARMMTYEPCPEHLNPGSSST